MKGSVRAAAADSKPAHVYGGRVTVVAGVGVAVGVARRAGAERRRRGATTARAAARASAAAVTLTRSTHGRRRGGEGGGGAEWEAVEEGVAERGASVTAAGSDDAAGDGCAAGGEAAAPLTLNTSKEDDSGPAGEGEGCCCCCRDDRRGGSAPGAGDARGGDRPDGPPTERAGALAAEGDRLKDVGMRCWWAFFWLGRYCGRERLRKKSNLSAPVENARRNDARAKGAKNTLPPPPHRAASKTPDHRHRHPHDTPL